MAKDTKDKGGAEQELIRELAELLNETGLTEIEIEKSGLKVRVARTLTMSASVAAHSAPAAAPVPGWPSTAPLAAPAAPPTAPPAAVLPATPSAWPVSTP